VSFTISHVAAILPLVVIADRPARARAKVRGRHSIGAKQATQAGQADEAEKGSTGFSALAETAKRVALISGLTIGSMIPDSEKLTPIFRARIIEERLLHDPMGFVIVGIPLCFIAAWFFSYAIPVLQRAIGAVPKTNMRLIAPRTAALMLRFGVASLVGGISHIVLDSFTHGFGYVTHHVQTMTRVISVAGEYMTVAKLLWFITSIIGMAMVVLFMANVMRKIAWTKPDWVRLGVIAGASAAAYALGFSRKTPGRGGFLAHLKFGFLFASGVFFMTVAVFIVLDKLERLNSKTKG
jgi:Domain of unknown function (DUF4184)